MRSYAQISNIVKTINEEVRKTVGRVVEDSKGKVESMKGKSAQEIADATGEIVESIKTCLNGAYADGVALPEFITNVTGYENGVTFSLRSKLKVVPKYKKVVDLAINGSLADELADVMVEAAFAMLYQKLATANIEELNDKLTSICTDNEIPYTVSFAISDAKGMLVSISNNSIVFNAAVEEALKIDSLGIMMSGDEYSDMVSKDAIKKLVDAMKTSQTTVQFIKANTDLVKTLTGISTKKRASKLIREVYHRNAKYLNGVKAGVAYYEDDSVFALVEKAEDGTISVILNPFEIETLMGSKKDVVAAVKAL